MTTPTPETLEEANHRLAFAYNPAVMRELDIIGACIDAWQTDRARLLEVERAAKEWLDTVLPFGTDDEGIVFIGDNMKLDALRRLVEGAKP